MEEDRYCHCPHTGGPALPLHVCKISWILLNKMHLVSGYGSNLQPLRKSGTRLDRQDFFFFTDLTLKYQICIKVIWVIIALIYLLSYWLLCRPSFFWGSDLDPVFSRRSDPDRFFHEGRIRILHLWWFSSLLIHIFLSLIISNILGTTTNSAESFWHYSFSKAFKIFSGITCFIRKKCLIKCEQNWR